MGANTRQLKRLVVRKKVEKTNPSGGGTKKRTWGLRTGERGPSGEKIKRRADRQNRAGEVVIKSTTKKILKSSLPGDKFWEAFLWREKGLTWGELKKMSKAWVNYTQRRRS